MHQHSYQLLDFGDGRKLERFGPWLLDRPCPAADEAQADPRLWRDATARFAGARAGEGQWRPRAEKWPQAECTIAVGELGFSLGLAPLPSGQVGLFPEQRANWEWIAEKSRKRKAESGATLRVLNLFAYTGASTLAAAAVGAEVTHVDAAKSVVARARQNADVSGLAERPIRWIVEDAVKFCQREVKRGKQYDAVVLDPPSYGHGPKGESWQIDRDLLPLLNLCGELTAERRAFVVCTCHTPGIGPAELAAYLSEGLFGHCGQPPESGKLYLQTADGRKLPSGVFARWPG